MSVNIVQAARASAPYPWNKFWNWMLGQGYGAHDIQTMIENGVEPGVVMAVGFVLDESVSYPGLPDPDHLPDDIDGYEPSFRPLGGIST